MREQPNEKQKNYYDILEISSGAGQEEIYHGYIRAKNAYSQESLALYSLMTADECSNNLRLIEEAYSILGEPKKRAQYDEARGIVKTAPKVNAPFNPQSYATKGSPHLDNPFTANKLEERSSSLSSLHGISSETTRPNRATDITKLVSSKKFMLEYEVNPDFEKEIESAAEYSGAFLKRIREYKNMSLERLADLTRVSRSYLHYIEEESFEKLPAPVYVRGFVFQYAKCLKMNPDLVATNYLGRMKRLLSEKK